MICPKCKTSHVRRSQEAGAGDRVAGWFLLKPYRCIECKWRFRSWTPRADPTDVRKRLLKLRRSKATRRELAMYGIAGAIVAAIVYLILRQSAGSG